MKKFFEKYDLIKIAGILVILSVVLTWLIPTGYFSGTETVTEEITRVGLMDFYYYGLLGMYYFTVLVTFLFVLGGFYQLLSKQAGYQKLVKKISDKLKNAEIPVVLTVLLFFAVVGSLANEYFPILVFIPFVIAIFNQMKIDKITSFVATFGGLLVGTIGSTFSAKVGGAILDSFSIESKSILGSQTILFIAAYVLLAIFTIIRLKKQDNKKSVEYDKFALDTKTTNQKNAKAWPYVIGIIIFAVVTILAYLPWDLWGVTIFSKATDWVNELSIANQPVFSYIFGNFTAFGSWDIFSVQYMMLFATLLIRWFNKISWNEIFDCYGEGFKKMGYVVIVLLVVYLILEINVMVPVIPVIVDWIAGLTGGFNALLTLAGSFVASIFSVEMPYLISLAGQYYVATFTGASNVIAVILQSAFGFVSFFAPSSIILMLGLSYLDIKYKDWLKFIWKFLIAILVVIIVVVLIMA